jgi:hypothetical protein
VVVFNFPFYFSDPPMGLGPGSFPGATPLSVASSMPVLAQDNAGSAQFVSAFFLFSGNLQNVFKSCIIHIF